MRHFLTALGVLLIATLAAAMAVPHFVDFGRYRDAFEAQIASRTGQPARIEGPIKLRLLPTPSISLQNVRLGQKDAEGFVMFEADRIYAALAPTSLLRGEFQITEATLNAPILRLGEGVGSGVALPNDEDIAKLVSIEKLNVFNGTVLVARQGREALTFSDISGEVEASSLLGPARGNADVFFEGGKRHIRFALGKIEQGKTRIKALVEDPLLALRIDVDGALALGAQASDRFDGAIVLVANTALGVQEKVQLPLRVTSKAKLTGNEIALNDLELAMGQDNQPLTMMGKGSVTLAARPRYDIKLAAKSYDLDRPGPDGKPRRIAPVDLLREFAALMPQSDGQAPDVEGRVEVSAGALIIAGQTVVGPRAVFEQQGEAVRVVTFDGDLPGQTRVEFRSSPAIPGILSGSVLIDSRDPEKLHGWFNGVQRMATGASATTLRADLRSIRDGVSIDRIQLVRGSSNLGGRGEYLLPRPGVRPASRLSLLLTTPQLSIGDVPPFIINAERREEKPDLDFDFTLDAKRMTLEGVDKGQLTARVRRDGAITSIERIELNGLEGASLIASGTLGGGARRMTVKLDAKKLDAVIALFQQVFPGTLSDGLRRRAESLAPALGVATLANEEAGDSFQLDVDGQFGGTDIKASGQLVAKADIFVDVKASIANADSGRLAQQLGGTVRRASSFLPASGTFSMRGNPRATVDTSLAGSIFGVEAEVSGQIKLFQPLTPFEGTISARAPDLYPALAAMGIDPSFLPRGVRSTLVGKVESNLQKITIASLVANLSGSPVTGEIAFNLGQANVVAGQLKMQELDIPHLLATVTGITPTFMAGQAWSGNGFGKPMAPPLAGDLWIEAQRLRLPDGFVLDQPRGVVRFSNNAISFEHSSVRHQQARISGDMQIRRGGDNLFVASKIAFVDIDAEKLNLSLKGVAEGELQVSTSGSSMLKLMQGLAGTGQIRLRNVSIPGQDPAALDRLLAIPITKFGPADAQNIARRLESELAKAPLNIQELRLPVVIIDGSARFGPAPFETPASAQELSGSFDLARLLADLRITATERTPPPPWMDATATTQWRGPLSSLTRSLGVDQLVNGFLAAALQKDAELREIQEQDLRERSYFNRRLKAMEAEKRRVEEARLEAIKAEQARIEAERQRAADAARQRRLAEEAERQRLADEAARQRRAVEEAERQRRAAAEAERQKLRSVIEENSGQTAPERPAAAPEQ